MKTAATMLLMLSLVHGAAAHADVIRVAVASNFSVPARELANAFEAETGHSVLLSPGSSGKHYAQIINGAPFDLFLSADDELPGRLQANGKVPPGGRFTYTIGQLALWSRNPWLVDPAGNILKARDFTRLAIANPRLAPYGRAARELLAHLDISSEVEGRIVTGENVSQAFQFAWSGNADLAVVAWSQVLQLPESGRGSYWRVPTDYHAPIIQQAALLSDSPVASAFADYLRSPGAQQIITAFGYDSPHAD